MTPAFTASELKRVGTAATMIVVCGTLIILTMMMMLGHYNSLAHSGPKAVLDGAVIALLIGRNGRWRCLALLGTVYGLVLLLQVGVFYLLPVMMLAGIFGAMTGRIINLAHRSIAILAAAVAYELLAGCGGPIKIYFGTGGKSEPFVWALWLAELPLRAIGASIGVWVAGRLPRYSRADVETRADRSENNPPPAPRSLAHRTSGTWAAALRVIACIIASTLPLALESPVALGAICLLYILYAVRAGAGRNILHALLGLLWGWAVFGALSFAWHHDIDRVLDLFRTLILRFAPLTLASVVLVSTVRPVDVVRLLRRLRISAIVIIPFASVVRGAAESRRSVHRSIHALREGGMWRGPVSLLRHPLAVTRILILPHLQRWAGELAEETGERQREL